MGLARSSWSLLGRGLLRRTHVRSHPRLLGAGAVAILLYFLLLGRAGTATRFLIAADGGASVFLTAVWIMMVRATPDGMRRRAELEDEGRYTVLVLSVTAQPPSYHRVQHQFIKDLTGVVPPSRAAGTILRLQVLHEYHFRAALRPWLLRRCRSFRKLQANRGDSCFPANPNPIIGTFCISRLSSSMTFQVSDVQIEDHTLRRDVLAHGVLAFFFNVIILALTINIVAGLI